MNTGPSKVTQTNKTELSPEQKQLLNQGMQLTTPVASNPPILPTLPGADPLSTQAQNNIVSSATGGATSQFAGNLADASNFLLSDAIDPNSNPALQGAIQAAINPIRDEFQRVIQPGLRDARTGTGVFSSFNSSRAELGDDLANRAFMRQVGDTTSNIVSDAYTQGLDAMTKAVSMAPQTQRSLLFPDTVLDAVGQQRRLTDQQVAQSQFESELFPFNLGLQLIGATGAVPGASTTSSVTGAQPQQNPLTAVLGPIASAIAFM